MQIPAFNDPEVGIVISNSIFFNAKNKEKILYKKNPKEGYVFGELLNSYNISLETVIIRKSNLEDLQEWFDTRFEVIEEFDLFIRLSKNCKLKYINEILAKWRVHSSSWTWQRKDLFPKETRLFIKKITKEIPETKTTYRKSIDKLKDNIMYQEFLIDWEKNNKKVNRKDFKKTIFKSKKAFIIYLLSFLIPYKLFKYINEKRLILN